MKRILLTIAVLACSACPGAARENPFAKMAGQRYAQYGRALDSIKTVFARLDTVREAEILEQIRHVARTTGDKALELEAEHFNIIFETTRRGGSVAPIAGETLQWGRDLLEKAIEAGVPQVELRMRYFVIENYWLYAKNYELAFEECARQYERLEEIPAEDVPEKALFYLQIANSYYMFKDYATAARSCERLLAERETPDSFGWFQIARNLLGLCRRYGQGDLDRSDSCFRAIIAARYPPRYEYNRDNWAGIAEGNIGYNLFMRGEYDEAIPLLEGSIEKMLRYEDYAYASGPAVNLADIYLKKGDPARAKRYIDLAREYYRKMPREGRLARIYESLTRYYAAIGDAGRSTAYIDSTFQAKEAYEKEFNAMLLVRIEQKESASRQQKLLAEQEKGRNARQKVSILSGGFAVVCSLLAVVVLLYRKKRRAYQALVLKWQEWAGAERTQDTADCAGNSGSGGAGMRNIPPDAADFETMELIGRAMSAENLYRDPSLTADSLARRLGIKRYHVSAAINRCTGASFTAMVNEYRVREAVRLLSEKGERKFSIDAIAFAAGFNDRKSFHRVFRKTTGLSPSAFRSNIQNS